jgi:hypothetical protein
MAEPKGDKKKPEAAPKRQRVNRRAETAAAVRAKLAEAGAVITDPAMPQIPAVAAAIFDLGYAIGLAESGNLDGTTLDFARDLATSSRDRAIKVLETLALADGQS